MNGRSKTVAQRQFYFLSGLPRSGSTVLAAVLSQNPEMYVSPTSPLLGVMFGAKEMWDTSDQARGYAVPGQVERVLGGIMDSFYAHVEKPYVMDKNRAWVNPVNQKMLASALGKQPKILCTVRPIAEILASFLLLVRKNPNASSFIDRELLDTNQALTDENRCALLMSREGHVFQSWVALRDGFKAFPENLFLVSYEEIVTEPQKVADRIYSFLGLSTFSHDFSHITNPVQENDEKVYGLPGMHAIRPVLKKTSPDPRVVLGDLLWERYQGGEFWRT